MFGKCPRAKRPHDFKSSSLNSSSNFHMRPEPRRAATYNYLLPTCSRGTVESELGPAGRREFLIRLTLLACFPRADRRMGQFMRWVRRVRWAALFSAKPKVSVTHLSLKKPKQRSAWQELAGKRHMGVMENTRQMSHPLVCPFGSTKAHVVFRVTALEKTTPRGSIQCVDQHCKDPSLSSKHPPNPREALGSLGRSPPLAGRDRWK